MYVKIVSNIISKKEETGKAYEIYESAGFKRSTESPRRTLIIDLSHSTEELRKALKPRWRTELNRAGRNKLEYNEGTSDKLYDILIDLYEEMHAHKKFTDVVDAEEFKSIQIDLPRDLKMRLLVCSKDGRNLSASVMSPMGESSHGIIWATNIEGRDLRAAYEVQWKTIEWLKENNYRWYDLGGINPEKVPGPYRFKAGLAGRLGHEVEYMEMHLCNAALSLVTVKISFALMKLYPFLKRSLPSLKKRISNNIKKNQ
jgi:lipid II:glycine glycyltransferase (peptidoglycan interpeptide bridge formation enzyme)